MNTISAVIITHNEERNIVRCLSSLQGVAEDVVVVDSGSSDSTQSLCQKLGARFFHHDWAGYSEQKNYANSLATGDWILSIDADEALSDELRASLLQLKQSGLDADTIYSFNRLNNYCGSWIKHCGWYPDEKLRLWRNGSARWDGIVHEELRHDAAKQLRLDGNLLHYTYYSVADHAARQVKYATLAAEKAHQQGRRCGCGSLLFKPLWNFTRNYLLKGGILDGRAGFIICKMSAFYTFVKYAKLRELNRTVISD